MVVKAVVARSMETEINGFEARARCVGDDIRYVQLNWTVEAFVEYARGRDVSEMLRCVLLGVETCQLDCTAMIVERVDDCTYCIMRENDSVAFWDDESVVRVIDAYAVYASNRYRMQVNPTLIAIGVILVFLAFFGVILFFDVIVPR